MQIDISSNKVSNLKKKKRFYFPLQDNKFPKVTDNLVLEFTIAEDMLWRLALIFEVMFPAVDDHA